MSEAAPNHFDNAGYSQSLSGEDPSHDAARLFRNEHSRHLEPRESRGFFLQPEFTRDNIRLNDDNRDNRENNQRGRHHSQRQQFLSAQDLSPVEPYYEDDIELSNRSPRGGMSHGFTTSSTNPLHGNVAGGPGCVLAGRRGGHNIERRQDRSLTPRRVNDDTRHLSRQPYGVYISGTVPQ